MQPAPLKSVRSQCPPATAVRPCALGGLCVRKPGQGDPDNHVLPAPCRDLSGFHADRQALRPQRDGLRCERCTSSGTPAKTGPYRAQDIRELAVRHAELLGRTMDFGTLQAGMTDAAFDILAVTRRLGPRAMALWMRAGRRACRGKRSSGWERETR